MQRIACFLILFVGVIGFHGPAFGASSWSGTINCSYGSGTINLNIDDAGNVSGRMTNGTVRSGKLSGSSITFDYYNMFGNGGVFSGSVQGSSMSGTYTQRVGTASTCSWQASLVGRTAAKQKAAAKGRQVDRDCPVSIRHSKRATYYATNPCKTTSVIVVFRTIDPDKKCEQSVEVVFAGDSSHLLYSHFATAPRKVFQCNSLLPNGRKNPQCALRAVNARYGRSC